MPNCWQFCCPNCCFAKLCSQVVYCRCGHSNGHIYHQMLKVDIIISFLHWKRAIYWKKSQTRHVLCVMISNDNTWMFFCTPFDVYSHATGRAWIFASFRVGNLIFITEPAPCLIGFTFPKILSITKGIWSLFSSFCLTVLKRATCIFRYNTHCIFSISTVCCATINRHLVSVHRTTNGKDVTCNIEI